MNIFRFRSVCAFFFHFNFEAIDVFADKVERVCWTDLAGGVVCMCVLARAREETASKYG